MWRMLFIGSILFSLVDGFISNWQLGSPWALLYKDILLILAFIFFVSAESIVEVMRGLGKYLNGFVLSSGLLFIFITIAQAFNPNAPGLLLGVLGLKLYFLYWLLVPMTYAFANNMDRVVFLLKAIIIISVFINLFALYQFAFGPEKIIAYFGPGFASAFREAALDQANLTTAVRSFYRVIGTFASTGQYSNFVQANIMICFGMIFFSRAQNEKSFFYFAQILNLLGLLAAGSRGSILFTFFQIAVLIFFSRGRKKLGPVLLIAVIGFGIGLYTMGAGVRARFGTIQQTSLIKERTVGFTSTIFSKLMDRYPLGRGIGFASTAARHLNKFNQTQGETWVENYPTKLVLEVGVPGVISFFLFLLIFLKRWWFDWRLALTDEFWDIGFPITVYGVSYCGLMSLFGILETTPGALLICMVVGVVLRLVDFSQIRKGNAYPDANYYA